MDSSKNVLAGVADTLLDKSIPIEIDILTPRWYERILIRFGWMPSKRSFEIRPSTTGNMIRISKLLVQIDPNVFNKDSAPIDSNINAYDKYGDLLVEVVATAIVNTEKGPGKEMIRFVRENLTAAELLRVAYIIIHQLDLVNFTSTIILLRGVSLLNTEETIASGESLED